MLQRSNSIFREILFFSDDKGAAASRALYEHPATKNEKKENKNFGLVKSGQTFDRKTLKVSWKFSKALLN